jgi:hypothetical protein
MWGYQAARAELTVVVNANLPVLCCKWCPRYKAPGLHVPQSCLNLCPDKMDSRLSVVGNAAHVVIAMGQLIKLA